MLKKLIGFAALAGATLFSASAFAQDATGPVGTWFAAQANPYIWVFHGDGTMNGFDAALGGILIGGDGAPRQVGLQSAWFGDWTQNDDGSVRGYVIKMSTESATGEVPGRLATIFQGTINFTPADGAFLICVERTNTEGGVFNPETNALAGLPQVETCTADYAGMAVASMTLDPLTP